jgi:hypothetical protein
VPLRHLTKRSLRIILLGVARVPPALEVKDHEIQSNRTRFAILDRIVPSDGGPGGADGDDSLVLPHQHIAGAYPHLHPNLHAYPYLHLYPYFHAYLHAYSYLYPYLHTASPHAYPKPNACAGP